MLPLYLKFFILLPFLVHIRSTRAFDLNLNRKQESKIRNAYNEMILPETVRHPVQNHLFLLFIDKITDNVEVSRRIPSVLHA